MAAQDTFTNGMSKCMNSNFAFPGIGSAGLPNFSLGTFLATLAGINFALQFIPPTPATIPKISLPTVDIFIKAFLGGVKMPSAYASVSLGPVTLPGVSGKLPGFDATGILKLSLVCISLPFQLITTFIKGLLKGQIILPTVSGIQVLFNSLALSAGLSGLAVAQFGGCVAQSIEQLFSSMI